MTKEIVLMIFYLKLDQRWRCTLNLTVEGGWSLLQFLKQTNLFKGYYECGKKKLPTQRYQISLGFSYFDY